MTIHPETTIDDDFAVTVPEKVREQVGLEPGDRLHWTVEDGRLIVEVVRGRYGAAEDLEPIDMGETNAVELTEVEAYEID